MKSLNHLFFGLILGIILSANFAFTADTKRARDKKSQTPFNIKITAWGPNQETIEAAKKRVENYRDVQSVLSKTKYRLLEFNYLENESKVRTTQFPTHFQVVFYDYTNDKTIVVTNDFAGRETIKIREEFYQPLPSEEEFAEALKILRRDEKLVSVLTSDSTTTFRPMPPVTVLDGTTERLVNVGINAAGNPAQNEVVSVGIKSGKTFRHKKGAPETSKAAAQNCGVRNSFQETTARGTAGQYQLTVTQNRAPLWEMLVIRPSASSGTHASGIEIRDVRYKGKSVLKRGHAPVLNVEYPSGACGPFRDWLFQEDAFTTPEGAVEPVEGIKIIPAGGVATTVLESGNDTGNFRGIAVYTQNDETVLVTEMQAAWYRYIMEWRFAADGTIRPRFGFGATDNPCVCATHIHHIYWRLDFDIVNPINKVFQVERGRKFLQPITTETTRIKKPQTNRRLLIQNSNGDEAYMLVPSLSDGMVTNFGRSDLWVLKYKNVAGGSPLLNEIDDGFDAADGECTANNGSCININKFINNESVSNEDVVIWYGAHFSHATDGEHLLNPERHAAVISGDHVVGPDLRPVRW
ncbi:MAG: hypothetical protein WKF90_06615 [Pyrinomonadaceae bacterium]